MATEKQIAANRANARKSTGPRTAAGKKKSSRNAYQHGLSRPDQSDPSSAAKIDAIAQLLSKPCATDDQLTAAQDYANAQWSLARIRAIRAAQWAKIDLNETLEANTKELKRLASLDRYERYELTKRRRASEKLHQ